MTTLTPYQAAKAIEETSLNAWPCLKHLLVDGWIVRLADGYSRRNNSVNAVYAGELPAAQKITRCEQIFQANHLPITFRMTPFVQPANLDVILSVAGYEKTSATSVQTADLANLPPLNPAIATQQWTTPDETWATAYTSMNEVPPHKHNAFRAILAHIPLEACYLTVLHQNEIVSCGLGIVERPYVGLFDIVTHPAWRGNGFGRELVLGLLHWARGQGAGQAYLQVVVENKVAQRLYAKLGFREIYQYWYRVK